MSEVDKDRLGELVALRLLAVADERTDADEVEGLIREVACDATDLAVRVMRARSDPSWRRVFGRPHLNERLDRVRRALRSPDYAKVRRAAS